MVSISRQGRKLLQMNLGNFTPSCKLMNSNQINGKQDYTEICTRKYIIMKGALREIKFITT